MRIAPYFTQSTRISIALPCTFGETESIAHTAVLSANITAQSERRAAYMYP